MFFRDPDCHLCEVGSNVTRKPDISLLALATCVSLFLHSLAFIVSVSFYLTELLYHVYLALNRSFSRIIQVQCFLSKQWPNLDKIQRLHGSPTGELLPRLRRASSEQDNSQLFAFAAGAISAVLIIIGLMMLQLAYVEYNKVK